MITFIIFINYLILTITTISFFLLFYNGWRFVIKKSLDTFQYKINNFFVCWFISMAYIFFFVVFLYWLRLYTYGRTLNLKTYYYFVKKLSSLIYFFLDSLIFFYFLLFILILLGIYILLIMNINKIAIKNILKLFLYYLPKHKFHIKERTPFNKKISKFFEGLRKFGSLDLFSYFLYEYVSDLILTIGTCKLYIYSKNIKSYNEAKYKYLDIVDYLSNKKWWFKYFHPLNLISQLKFKKYYWFITISPLLVALTECIVNDFVIHYTFYYLLVYVPLILIRTITNFAFCHNFYFCCNLWRIYYYNAPFIYALPARTPTVKHIWELHLMNNLKILGLGITTQFTSFKEPLFCMDFQDHLLGQMAFFQNAEDVEKDLYCNGTITAKMIDGVLYEYTEESDFSESNINFETGEVTGEILPPKIISHLGDPWIILYNNIYSTKK